MAGKHPLLVKPFALAALAIALFGSVLGAILIVRIHLALGAVDPFWIQVHGQAQVFGFMVLFVVGFGTYVVPRIAAGQPIRSAFALPALAALFVAALLAFLAPLVASVLLRRALAVLVAFGCVAGAVALEAPLGASRRERGRRRHEHVMDFSLAFLALAGLADGAAWWLAGEAELPATFATAAWRLALEGFACGMAFGVSARMFSGFLGIRAAFSYSPVNRATAGRERVFAAAVWLWALSVALGAAGALFAAPGLERAADVLFAAGVAPLCFMLGLAPTRGGPAIDRTQDPLFPFGARASYALLLAGALIGAATAVAELAGAATHSFWVDARRHLVNIGFLFTLIATMAGRMAPGFARRKLALPWLRAFAMGAFALGAVLRALEAVAGQWGPAWLLWLSAASGPLSAAALVALAASLGATLLVPSPARRDPAG